MNTRPWTILPGDCRVTLRDLAAESIDAVVTDTPYGLSTLLDPPNLDREALWQKLTSGAKESPIKTLMHAWLDTGENPVVKGRGFMGKEWDALVPPPNTWREVWRVMKPGAYCLAFGGTRTYSLIEMSLRFADFEIEDTVSWLYGQGFPKRVRLDLKIDQHYGKADDRQVIGVNPSSRPNSKRKNGGGFDSLQGAESAGLQHLTAAATLDAARLVGWDRALRPGWEPIIVAIKPLRGTVAENALVHGTGGLHVDACRLPRGDADAQRERHGKAPIGYGGSKIEFVSSGGGYPANVAMDEEVAKQLDAMSGHTKDGVAVKHNVHVGKKLSRMEFGFTNTGEDRSFGGGGGASRFFYTAKASSSERDAGLEDMPALTAGERCDREDGSAGVNGYAGTRGEGGRNPHPTVKPVALMRWLCRLASPPGAWDPDEPRRPVILDPFAGSGSTLVAALQEGVRVVGCEIDPKMADVAARRCQHAYALPREESGVDRSEAPPGTQGALF